MILQALWSSQALQSLCLAIFTFLAWSIWMVVFNVFLHRLSHIPGPKLPAATGWYETYFEVWQKGQYPFQLKRLHEAYGPILRPVPDEVHISDPAFLDTIYAARGRDSDTSDNGLMVEQSVAGARDFHLHKLRRDALNPFFNQKAVLGMEELFLEKRDAVAAIFDAALTSSDITNLSDIYFAFANDLVKSFCFNEDAQAGLLGNLTEAKRQREALFRLLTGVKITKHFAFVTRIFGKLLPSSLTDRTIPPAVMDLIRFKANARKDIDEVLADKTNDHKGRHSVFYAIKDDPDLPISEKTPERLEDEATLLVMAGTESTAKSLGYGSFYLLQHPEALEMLRREIGAARAASSNGKLSLANLLALPYMNAVLMETNRLTFGVTSRMIRYAHEPISYTASYGPYTGETYVLPAGTKMSCLTWCTHTDETLFPDALCFDPQRFLGHSADVARRKQCTMALGKGHRRCVGMNVANAGLCLIFATFADYDMELFDTDYRDVAFLHDYQIAHPRLDSAGIRVKINARHARND